jgi:hypothetical protein
MCHLVSRVTPTIELGGQIGGQSNALCAIYERGQPDMLGGRSRDLLASGDGEQSIRNDAFGDHYGLQIEPLLDGFAHPKHRVLV